MQEKTNQPPLKDEHRLLVSKICDAVLRAARIVGDSARQQRRGFREAAREEAAELALVTLSAELAGLIAPAPAPPCRVCGKVSGAEPRLCDACAWQILRLRPPPPPAPVVDPMDPHIQAAYAEGIASAQENLVNKWTAEHQHHPEPAACPCGDVRRHEPGPDCFGGSDR